MNSFRRAFKGYQNILFKFPFATQATQAGILMGVGDVISQTAIEKNKFKDINWMRTARFASVGFCLAGPGLRVWYLFLDRRVGRQGGVVVLKKVLLDQFLFAPIFVAALISSISLVNGHSVTNTAIKMKADYPDILITNYYIWPWVQLCNFYLVPLNYQVLVVQTVAVFWNTYLSYKANKPLEKAASLSADVLTSPIS